MVGLEVAEVSATCAALTRWGTQEQHLEAGLVSRHVGYTEVEAVRIAAGCGPLDLVVVRIDV